MNNYQQELKQELEKEKENKQNTIEQIKQIKTNKLKYKILRGISYSIPIAALLTAVINPFLPIFVLGPALIAALVPLIMSNDYTPKPFANLNLEADLEKTLKSEKNNIKILEKEVKDAEKTQEEEKKVSQTKTTSVKKSPKPGKLEEIENLPSFDSNPVFDAVDTKEKTTSEKEKATSEKDKKNTSTQKIDLKNIITHSDKKTIAR